MTIDPTDLKLRIDEAFREMPYPGDEHLVACNSWECEGMKNTLKGLHWRDVSIDILDHLRTALSFMSPEGFRFYLPAYMICSVMDYDQADFIPATVIRRLTPFYASDIDRILEQIASGPRVGPFSSVGREQWTEKYADYYRSGEAERWFHERVSGLNEAQCKVIRQFLEYMRDAYSTEFVSEDAKTAIERYWHQF